MLRICLLFIFFCVLPPVFARDITFTTLSAQSTDEHVIKLEASASGFLANQELYIKGVFFKQGSSNYFGFTQNGEQWIKNSSSITAQRKVVVGQWDQLLILRPDFFDSGFSQSGMYVYKIGYYLVDPQGKLSAVNWSTTQQEIYLSKPETTLMPTKHSTPTPTVFTPTPSLRVPSNTPVISLVSMSRSSFISSVSADIEISPVEEKKDTLGVVEDMRQFSTNAVDVSPWTDIQLFEISLQRLFVLILISMSATSALAAGLSIVLHLRQKNST
jgi:hypothetical protein